MSDTLQSALAEQGTTPAQQQGKSQRSTADKAKSAITGLSAFNTATNLMGNTAIGGPLGLGLSLGSAAINGPAMMANLANMISAGVAAFGGNDPNVAGSLSSSIAGTYGRGQGGMFGGSGAEAYGQAGLGSTTAARGLSAEEALQSGLYGDIVGGEPSGGSPSGGGDPGPGAVGGDLGNDGGKFNQGGLVAPRGTGGLQDLMRGYI